MPYAVYRIYPPSAVSKFCFRSNNIHEAKYCPLCLRCKETVRQLQALDPAQMRLHSLRFPSTSSSNTDCVGNPRSKISQAGSGTSVWRICRTVPCTPTVPLPMPTEPVKKHTRSRAPHSPARGRTPQRAAPQHDAYHESTFYTRHLTRSPVCNGIAQDDASRMRLCNSGSQAFTGLRWQPRQPLGA